MRLAAFALAAAPTDNLQKIYSYIAKHNTSVLSTHTVTDYLLQNI